jgi:hypothetical protein
MNYVFSTWDVNGVGLEAYLKKGIGHQFTIQFP